MWLPWAGALLQPLQCPVPRGGITKLLAKEACMGASSSPGTASCTSAQTLRPLQGSLMFLGSGLLPKKQLGKPRSLPLPPASVCGALK